MTEKSQLQKELEAAADEQANLLAALKETIKREILEELKHDSPSPEAPKRRSKGTETPGT